MFDVANTPAIQVFPMPGAPLFATQVEEFTHTFPDGTSSTKIIRSKIYRDAAGRMRVEWNYKGPDGTSFPVVYLLDPAARSITILLVPYQIAHRTVLPESQPFQVGFPALGEPLPEAQWQTSTESLGKRIIEGLEVEGTQTTMISTDQPSLQAVRESWVSRDLGSAALLVEASGPNWKHAAQMKDIERRGPDPALFVIPSDFTIQDSEQ